VSVTQWNKRETSAVDPWRKRSETVVYDRFRRILNRTFDLPNGEVAEFEILDLLDSVAVLALTPSNEVILVEEFRPGPEAVLFELPGGVVERGQTPQEAAREELLEETGYEGELLEAGSLIRDAYATNVKHVFAATNCRHVAQPEQPEFTAPLLMPFDSFRDHLREGRLTDSEVAYRALDELGLL
jgi:ADP-ribose pyrophosphatase